MNGMNLSGKPGIVHAMQMPPDVRAAADAADPAADRHVALRDRSLAAELDQAPAVSAGRARELALLGEAGAAAALLHGPAEQPLRTALLVELEHRADARQVQRQVQQRLGDVVGLDRAAREVDDRQSGRETQSQPR